jgi:Reverse transcriptase (RNA-dependent DNA polymerase)
MDRVERLLKLGYFPSQLPPSFNTSDLAALHATFYTVWLELQEPPKKGVLVPKAPNSKAELFSVARVGHQRRVTSLPNPVAQTYLATLVTAHWGEFIAHYRKSKLSASHPRFLRHGGRATSIPSMQLLYDRKIAKSAGYRFMLKTDLSRFFPTIYTHSVPWAFHTKSIAKKNKNLTSKYFGNILDLALRQGQDGQTIGIPIGPDTSHMIAEAIATAVDLELKRRLKVWPAGFRYVDDYYLFFATLKDAEEALAALVRALNEFELQINFAKTITCPVIEISEDFWTHQLRNFSIASEGHRQGSDLNHFFELAKDLARKNADESVMVYALKRISSTIIRKESWDSFEAHVCHAALAYPNSLQTVARLLSTYARVGYPINLARLTRLVNASIEDHAPLGHHSEVAWCLWMTKDLGLSLNETNVDRISEMHSSVCALLLLDLFHTGKLPKTPKTSNWKTFENQYALYGELWLMSYEAGMRGWGGFSDAHIKADPYFNVLHLANVHFYDPTATVTPVFHVKTAALKAHDVANETEFFALEEIDDIDHCIEYEEGDGGYEGVVVPDHEIEGDNIAGGVPDDLDDHPF